MKDNNNMNISDQQELFSGMRSPDEVAFHFEQNRPFHEEDPLMSEGRLRWMITLQQATILELLSNEGVNAQLVPKVMALMNLFHGEFFEFVDDGLAVNHTEDKEIRGQLRLDGIGEFDYTSPNKYHQHPSAPWLCAAGDNAIMAAMEVSRRNDPDSQDKVDMIEDEGLPSEIAEVLVYIAGYSGDEDEELNPFDPDMATRDEESLFRSLDKISRTKWGTVPDSGQA